MKKIVELLNRIKGYIQMKRQQRQLRNKMSLKTYYEIKEIADEVQSIWESLESKTEECIDAMYNEQDNERSEYEIRNGIVPEYSYYYGYLNELRNRMYLVSDSLDRLLL